MASENQSPEIKDVIQIDEELLDNLSGLVENNQSKNILAILRDIHSADIAEIINHLAVDEADFIFSLLEDEQAGEVLTEIDENLREKLLQDITAEKITNMVEELDTDDLTDVISDLPDNIAEHVLDNIDPEDSKYVKELLKYPEDSAGGIMNSDFVSVLNTGNVHDAIEELRRYEDEIENIYQIYVLKKNRELVGIIKMTSLILNPPETALMKIVHEDLISVEPTIDQEEVANLMEKYDLVSLPVVDNRKRMLGRITIDDVVDVIQEEAEEDINKLAGLSEDQETTDSIVKISRIRLPWLIIALSVELVGVVVLARYEDFLSKFVVASFFIPVLMAMGGSSGTQAAIVMVRGLTSSDLWLRDSIKRLTKEFLVAVLNGIVVSSILLGATFIFFDIVTFRFSLVLSAALLTIIISATMMGAGIPLFLKKIGADPAVATGPFVTTMNDILGLIIYLSYITFFMVR
ncbi:MAG: magnesium transporter [Melioribacteraceae bacterium]|nr:magnesium transporter [Melioribacteraceae bacterium]MCF8265393.1 magnesium transporter [Melioribacteraceae bacterium]MCF8412035.1 magnesium transporter [Melioribacteraceae bacterium]